MRSAAFHSTGSSPSIRSKTSIGRLKIPWQADASNRSFDSEPEYGVTNAPTIQAEHAPARASTCCACEYSSAMINIHMRICYVGGSDRGREPHEPGQKLAILRYYGSVIQRHSNAFHVSGKNGSEVQS